MNIRKKMCKNSPPKFNSKTKSNQLVKITSMYTHIVPCMLFKEHSSRVIHRKVTIAVTAVWVPLILIDCPLFHFFYRWIIILLGQRKRIKRRGRKKDLHQSNRTEDTKWKQPPSLQNKEKQQTKHTLLWC